MPTITADTAMATQLAGAKGISEIRDSDGRFLGVFTPVTMEEAKLYLHARLTVDPAEIRAAKARKGKTYTTAEVLARLESLVES